jgi:ABC-type transport system involved in multi-copper enzyme maturation permease subunit
MPVHERGYTHWSPSGARVDPPWLVIARRGLLAPLKRRWTLVLLFASWVPAIVKGAIVFFKAKAGQFMELAVGGDWTSVTPAGFLSFVEGQRFFVFVITVILGAGLIARDKQDNGLSLYFSRPISLFDYLGGKVLVVLAGFAAVTLVPSLLLCLFAYLVDPTAAGLDLLLLTPLRLVAMSAFTGIGISLVLLAFSALGTRTVLVVVWWAVLCLGGDAIGNIGDGLGLDMLQYVNFLGHWHNASALLMDASPRLPIAPAMSLLVCVAMMAGAILTLRQRIKPVEVVV